MRNVHRTHREKITTAVPLLVKWYAKNARDLPWRRTNDAYAIWVSEIMLQQTQVKTVIPYYERWMERFPTIRTLAEASEEEVLKLWAGLGYYSRARNLHKAAKSLNGEFPRDFDSILKLPGIGRYTAGAISSIAFNQATPILDGNVMRVLARLFALTAPIKSLQTKLWSYAEALVSSTRSCSELNQSLMELGATVCIPRNPLCTECPASALCSARKENKIEKCPNVEKQKAFKQIHKIAFLVERGGKVLLRKRENGEHNAGLWGFPTVLANGTKPGRTILKTFRHTITNNRIQVDLCAGEDGVEGTWVKWSEVETLPLASIDQKIVKFLRSQLTGRAATSQRDCENPSPAPNRPADQRSLVRPLPAP